MTSINIGVKANIRVFKMMAGLGEARDCGFPYTQSFGPISHQHNTSRSSRVVTSI